MGKIQKQTRSRILRTDSVVRGMRALNIEDSAAANQGSSVLPEAMQLDSLPREAELAVDFNRILRLNTDCNLKAKHPDALDMEPSYHFPPRIKDLVELRGCPPVVWHSIDFPKLASDWMKVLCVDFHKPYDDILRSYEDATATSIHWRAVLEFGRELITAAYVSYNGSVLSPAGDQLENYRGPSRSVKEFEARKKIWRIKKEVWQAIPQFASSPGQQSLDDIMFPGGSLDVALLAEERRGLFQPWTETSEIFSLYGEIDHTKQLPNPFDPVMLDGMTLTEIEALSDF